MTGDNKLFKPIKRGVMTSNLNKLKLKKFILKKYKFYSYPIRNETVWENLSRI